MKVSVDVYTKDLDAATTIFKEAYNAKAEGLDMASRDWEDDLINIMFSIDHTSPILNSIEESGAFANDSDDL